MKLWVTYLRAIGAMFCWAITFVWYKIAYETYRPYEVVFFRLLIASVVLFVVMVLSRHREKIEPKDLWRLMAVALFEPFLYFNGEANAMQYVSSSFASIIIATIPIFAALGAWLFLKEKLTGYVILGVIVSTFGVVVMSYGGGELRATLTGIMFLTLAIFGAVGYSMLVRPLTLKYSTLTIVAYQTMFGALYFLPLFLAIDGHHFLNVSHTLSGIYTVIAMSLFASIGAFVLYTDVIRSLGVAKSNIFTNLIPVFVVFQAYFILGDKIGIRTVAGLTLTLFGLLLSQYADLKKLRQRYVLGKSIAP
ncbi:MAG: DMT family transporter [Candidatus Cloacimonetes bacterium]|jgi:drug/metabolite transporter (DMT)-like permease|nr:DMT family transporter [Candidatus Cloacimonadota bacterium]MDD2423946.1 DMT family transporter [Candidatus Cloacimonadota bacterium]MDD3562362.1 DMT family transporter [Candidatus Cloacimonadota bacterium]MDD4277769.1 DMT family transporter [Candidatus Cloacimonadota bacterium]MDY0325345.1 DMT family transporter [Candidatus Cloacimonadaceae bacterium]